jgi:hypothetical protein
MDQSAKGIVAAAITLLALACAPATTTTPVPGTGSADRTAPSDAPWPVQTREHVDLWLHGFAMLQDDTSLVPLFSRGYRDRIIVAKNSANITTLLDSNRDQLRARFSQNLLLGNAQFVPLYFRSMGDLQQAISYFLQAGGNPQAAGSREIAAVIALLAGYFPAEGDRNWLRQFWPALSDESAKFYHNYWIRQQSDRAPVIAAVDSLWQQVHRPQLQRFLDNTQQARGSVLLSLPLNGEGRTLHSGADATTTAVTFPETRSAALDAIFVTVHEIVAAITNPAVADHLTPAEQREGLAERYTSAAAVRGGAILLQRLSPGSADAYARYYLRAANRSVGANPMTSLANVFPLTEQIRTAITRQLDIVLGGI